MKIINVFLGAATGLMLLGGMTTGAAAQSTSSSAMTASDTSSLSTGDRQFIKTAAEGGLAEVELGKLASEKGSSDEVKQFGQRMVTDHTKANDELKQLASSKGVDVPKDLNAKHKATRERLAKLSGAEFDKAYMKDMVQDHQKDVSEFRAESNKAKDSDLKSFASKTLPTLEEHLNQAKSIAPKVGATSGTTASKM
jgi:putative membrane protein